MEWLLSVSDHIVELVPSWQRYPDGSRMEVWGPSKPNCLFSVKILDLNDTCCQFMLFMSDVALIVQNVHATLYCSDSIGTP